VFLADQLQMAWRGVAAHRLRSALTMLGIAVGIAAVVLLTALGEGVRGFVLSEFSQFGTNLLAVVPGKTNTLGLSPATIHTTRPLTLADADALARLPQVTAAVPALQGNAEVEWGARRRRVTVLGVGAEAPAVWRFEVATGRFLDPDGAGSARAQAVLGATLRRELFGERPALGERVRIGGERYRVTGVMAPKGQFLGFDMDDTVFIPAARAQRLFDRNGVMEIDLLYRPGSDVAALQAAVRARLVARHGHEDFTLVTQEQMLEVLDSVLGVLTFAVAALGGISLLVGGVGVLTIMTIAVTERTGEVGLLRALGAGRGQVVGLFLGEAAALAGLGGLLGVAFGAGGALLLGLLVPALPVAVSWFYLGLAEALALLIGLLAGVIPARRAAGLEPVEALRAE
jgi:putative ABC transport system permease protein